MVLAKTRGIVCVTLLALCGAFAPVWAAGPLSELYLSTGNRIYVVQGDQIVRSWPTRFAAQYALAVVGTVQTMRENGCCGSEYYRDTGQWTGLITMLKTARAGTPPGCGGFHRVRSGGVAPLNHRLMAGNPPGFQPPPTKSVAWSLGI